MPVRLSAMPSTYHRQQAAAGSLPARAQTNHRTASLRNGDICRGCIVWLPPKSSHDDAVLCNRDGCCGRSALQEGGYDHPVVVLKIRQRENSRLYGDILCTVVCVCTICSQTPHRANLIAGNDVPCHFASSIPRPTTSTTALPRLHTYSPI
jgi:hypothetical protein